MNDELISQNLKEETLAFLGSTLCLERVSVRINGKLAYVNLEDNRVTLPEECPWTEDLWVTQIGLLLHEIGHVLLSGFNQDMSIYELQALGGIEDARVETLFRGYYPQSDPYFRKINEDALLSPDFEQVGEDFFGVLRTEIDPTTKGLIKKIDPIFHPLLETCIKMCEEADVIHGNFENCKRTSKKIAALVRKEYEIMNDKLKIEEAELKSDRMKKTGRFIDPYSGGTEELENDLEEARTKELEKTREIKTLRRKFFPEKRKIMNISSDGKFSDMDDGQLIEAGKKLTEGGKKDFEGEMEEADTVSIEMEKIVETDPIGIMSKELAIKNGTKIAEELKKELVIKASERRHKQSGSLDMKEIMRQMRTRGEVYNPKMIFQRKEPMLREHSVMVLCDYSGSMQRDKNKKLMSAKQSMITLGVALEKLGVDYSLRAFSASANKPRAYDYVLKDFEDKLDNNAIDQIIETFRPIEYTDNRDGDSINNAVKILNSRNGYKLLIVISDGEPNANGYSGEAAMHHTREAIKNAEARGINVIGIGIEGAQDTVPILYKKNIVIQNIEELPEKLTKIYTDTVRRSL